MAENGQGGQGRESDLSSVIVSKPFTSLVFLKIT